MLAAAKGSRHAKCHLERELIIAQPGPVAAGIRTTDSAEHIVMFYGDERFLLDIRCVWSRS
jgi:hypothetical protein